MNSDSLMTSLLGGLETSTEQETIESSMRAREARFHGELLPRHADIVTAACEKRLQKLEEEKGIYE